ncbi:MAG: hypothetical protein WBL35_09535 [Ornithinibacter sp.]
MAATVAVLALGLSTSSVTAGAEEPSAPPYVAGWLALSTGATNTVTLVEGGAATQTYALSTNTSCALEPALGDLLTFTGTPGVGVGLNKGSIGVRESTNANGTSCSAVDSSSSERLALALGTAVTGQDLVGVSASLDVDLKQNAEIAATTSLDGVPTGTFTLQSGSRIVPGDSDKPTVTQCNNSSDSGPDAKTGNNCRWDLDAVFDSVELTAVAGSFSLMGGADGVVPGLPAYIGGSASVIELADGAQVVDCGAETASVSGGNVKSSMWKNVGGADCTPYPFFAEAVPVDEAGRPAAHFVKPSWAAGQAEWTTTFAYKGKVPTLEFSFDAADGTPAGYFKPATCTVVGGYVVPPQSLTGTNYACILDTVVDKKAKTVKFQVYVLGDAWMRG